MKSFLKLATSTLMFLLLAACSSTSGVKDWSTEKDKDRLATNYKLDHARK